MEPTESERRQDAPRERFARAADQPWAGDREAAEEFGTELAIVSRLRRTPTPGPDAATRQRIYERVRREFDAGIPAQTARIRHAAPALTAPPGRTDGSRPARSHGIRRRLATSVAAVLCLFAMLGGLSMLLARNALPGDTLYQVRRMTEQASVQMTPDPAQRATMQLGYASERLRDIAALRSAGAATRDFRIAFDDFDADTAAGARILTSLGTTASTYSFAELTGWVRETVAQVNTLATTLPADLGKRALASSALLNRIEQRIQTLRARLNCASVTNGIIDGIGPLPASSHDCTRRDAGRAPEQPQLTSAPTPTGSTPGAPERSHARQPGTGGGQQAPRNPGPSRSHSPGILPTLPPPTGRPLLPPPNTRPTIPHKPTTPPRHKPLITLTPLPGLPGISIG